MDLSRAVETFTELRAKIAENRSYLSGNETVTRVLLIDPVLEILGWDVRDPDRVELEYGPATSNRSTADYVLKHDNQNVAIVEAKRFGTDIGDLRHREQADGYARYAGVKFFVLTDGATWGLYERDLTTGLEDLKPVVSFDLRSDNLTRCALDAVSMWRPNFRADTSVSAASDPIVAWSFATKKPGHAESPDNESSNAQSEAGVQQESHRHTQTGETGPNAETKSREGWHAVADDSFAPTNRRAVKYRLHRDEFDAKNFTEVFVAIASWLIEEGKLSPNDAPIRSTPRGAKYVIASQPVHQNGNDFRYTRGLPKGLFMEVHYSSEDKLDMLRNLLNLSGIDGNAIHIKWE